MMKNEVLARFITIILCVLAVISIAAGGLGLHKNNNDAAENNRTLTKLKERTENYVNYSKLLEGKKSYAELKEELDVRQAEHDKAAAQHKTDLAEFTATKGGIISGKEQLRTAYDALVKADTELGNFEKMIPQLEEGLEAARSGGAQVEQAIIQAEAYARTQYQAGYEAAWKAAFKAQTQSDYDESLDTEDNPEYHALVLQIKEYVLSQMPMTEDQAAEMARQQVISNLPEGTPLSAEEGEQMFYESLASQMPADYAGMKIEDIKKFLAEAREKVRIGYESISLGNFEISKLEHELPEKEEKLNAEKEPLEKEAKELAEAWDRANEIKDTEKKLTSTKSLLSSNSNIKAAVDDGTELVEACNNEIARREAADARDYSLRKYANLMAVIGGIFGILSVPAAFEKTKSRFLLIAPVVIFTLCMAATEYFSLSLERGVMYSCLVAGIFGIVQLIVILPKKKVG